MTTTPVVTTYYLMSETHGTKVRAGTDELSARVRLIHAQVRDPFARYVLTTVEEAPVPQWIDGVGIAEKGN